MTKRPRLDKPVRTSEAQAATLRNGIVMHLSSVLESLSANERRGFSDPRRLDIEHALTELRALARPDSESMKRVLLRNNIPSDLALYAGVAFSSSDIRAPLVEKCRESLEVSRMEFEHGGEQFLRALILSTVGGRHADHEHLAKLHELSAKLARQGYSKEECAAVYVLYGCLDTRTTSVSGKSPAENLIDKVTSLVDAQSKLDAQSIKREQTNEGTFFANILRCVSIYADITQKVIEQSPILANDIRHSAGRFLSAFLGRAELYAPRWPGQSAIDPFVVLQTTLDERHRENPWLQESLKGTPFDARKFGALISHDVPRGLLAEAVVGLNGYHDWLLSRRARTILNALEGAEQRSAAPSDRTKEQCADLVVDFNRLHGEGELTRFAAEPGDITDSDDLIPFLKSVEKLSSWRSVSQLREKGDLHPMCALLRIIRPKDIVENDVVRQHFFELFRQMNVPDPMAFPEASQERTNAERQVAIVAASIRDVLASDDEYLDIPIVGFQESQSLRMHLEEYALSRFDQKIVEEGPYAYIHDVRHQLKPLYVPHELRGLTEEQRQAVAKNFDTASGIAAHPEARNRWTRRPAEAWSRLPHFYERVLKYAQAAVTDYYKLDRSYRVLFYRSAREATAEVASKVLQITRGDRVIITNQEFSGIVDQFTDLDATVGESEIAYTNDPDTGRTFSSEEMFLQMKSLIEKEGLPRPKAILLSSKTRFGDAICAGSRLLPRKTGLQDLIARLKDAFPTIPVIVDGCQSVGRNDNSERNLRELECDIFLNSGGKALGLDNVATLILKKDFPSDEPNWLNPFAEQRLSTGRDWLEINLPNALKFGRLSRVRPEVSSQYAVAIAEMGMMLRSLSGRVSTWDTNTILPGNSLRLVNDLKMRKLTSYLITKAESYAGELRSKLRLAGSLDDAQSREFARQFGCRVIYPSHRSPRDYNGIVTVTFPNIAYPKKAGVADGGNGEATSDMWRSDFLPRELEKVGYRVLPCLHGNHALRISVNLTHDIDESGSSKDVDALFTAIQTIHLNFLRRHIAEKRISTLEALMNRTPRVPDDWMPHPVG